MATLFRIRTGLLFLGLAIGLAPVHLIARRDDPTCPAGNCSACASGQYCWIGRFSNCASWQGCGFLDYCSRNGGQYTLCSCKPCPD